jgi:hypothetical protein
LIFADEYYCEIRQEEAQQLVDDIIDLGSPAEGNPL